MVSNQTLAKICVYGGVFTCTSALWMQTKLVDQVKDQEYFREAMKTLRQHRGAASLLGEPIKVGNFDHRDGEKNYANSKEAHFEVTVKGPKAKGICYFWANRDDQAEKWIVKRVELELNNQPDKRLIVKKEQETK